MGEPLALSPVRDTVFAMRRPLTVAAAVADLLALLPTLHALGAVGCSLTPAAACRGNTLMGTPTASILLLSIVLAGLLPLYRPSSRPLLMASLLCQAVVQVAGGGLFLVWLPTALLTTAAAAVSR